MYALLKWFKHGTYKQCLYSKDAPNIDSYQNHFQNGLINISQISKGVL